MLQRLPFVSGIKSKILTEAHNLLLALTLTCSSSSSETMVHELRPHWPFLGPSNMLVSTQPHSLHMAYFLDLDFSSLCSCLSYIHPIFCVLAKNTFKRSADYLLCDLGGGVSSLQASVLFIYKVKMIIFTWHICGDSMNEWFIQFIPSTYTINNKYLLNVS